MDIVLRAGTPNDAEACGRICYDAFYAISTAHNFPPDFPSPAVSVGVLAMMLAHPGFYVVVAERAGVIVGSNGVDERSVIAGIGPITVNPGAQNSGVGRQLMQHVLERAAARGCPGVRLVQAAFHNRSLALYTKLGFDPREPLSCMQGPPLHLSIPGYAVRAATAADLAPCSQLCLRLHGHTREGEVRDAIQQGMATVVEHDGRITGYTTALAFFGHTVGESNTDLKALIGAAPAFGGSGFLLPTRNADLLRWCLNHGLHIVQPLTLMSLGLYNEPQGVFLPSIAF
jgi:GNAT superfamily N-acetyltransferase